MQSQSVGMFIIYRATSIDIGSDWLRIESITDHRIDVASKFVAIVAVRQKRSFVFT